MSMIPLSDSGDANPYDTNEDGQSSVLHLDDLSAAGTRRISRDLGPLRGPAGGWLSSADPKRRARILEQTASVDAQLKEITQIRAGIEAVSEKNEAELKAQEAEIVRKDLEHIRDQHSDNALGVLASKVEDLVRQHPVLLSCLQSLGLEIGVPGEKDFVQALEMMDRQIKAMAVQDKKLSDLQRENENLLSQLEARSEVQSTKSSDNEELKLMAQLFDFDFGEVENWPLGHIRSAIYMAKSWESQATIIKPGASQWMCNIKMGLPKKTGYSARENSVWLFSQVHKQELDFSLADVHALAATLEDAPRDVVLKSLAFLHQFVMGMVRIMKKGCNTHCTLIFLRSLELLLLHLAEPASGYRIEAMSTYQNVAPLLVPAQRESRLIQGLVTYITILMTGTTSVKFSECLVMGNSPLTFERKQLLSSGADLLLIELDQVHFIHRNKYKIELHALEGFRFVVSDFPRIGEEWCSGWLDISKANIDMLNKDFGFAMRKLEDMNEFRALDSRLESFHIGYTE